VLAAPRWCRRRSRPVVKGSMFASGHHALRSMPASTVHLMHSKKLMRHQTMEAETRKYFNLSKYYVSEPIHCRMFACMFVIEQKLSLLIYFVLIF
jgi:hypothetical protein